MTIYSCHYPILHKISMSGEANTYKIALAGETIYEGKVFKKGNENDVEIDISEICREYLYTSYEEKAFSGSTPKVVEIEGTRMTFNVSAESPGSYDVMYNYNTDYISKYEEKLLTLNQPILREVAPDQWIGVTGLMESGTQSFSCQINGVPYDSSPELSTKLFCLYEINLRNVPNLAAGDTIILSHNGQALPAYTVSTQCNNRFALYYVNKLGALDYLLCSGKGVESWSAKRTDIRTYYNNSDRKNFEHRRLNQQIDKQYEFNTGLLKDEEAANIDNLIYTPKLWVHDLVNDTITAAYITDSSYTVKNFRNDRKVQYTIKATESQQYLRR